MFQSTHPRRVWPKQGIVKFTVEGFNPHTHAGCDYLQFLLHITVLKVSIHTPTQGVTYGNYSRNVNVSWFQSTHPRRVWQDGKFIESFPLMFQSTHPRRVWLLNRAGDIIDWLFQSTHPRRVWPYHPRHKYSHEGFNPHTHAGCDPAQASQNYQPGGFQSTHPRRVWLLPFRVFNHIAKFQSTHPRRVWLILDVGILFSFRFQSTHPRRVWLSWRRFLTTRTRFQSTHPRRVWLIGAQTNNIYLWVSIHTPTQGVTTEPLGYKLLSRFQSTHPRRVWPLPDI